MAFGRKTSSSSVAKERLKLVLIHDRAGTSPSSNVMEMLRKDIFAVISKYFDVVEADFDVEIKNTSDMHTHGATRLTADVPIRSIKNLGRNKY
jgi:cell division topological specificity factor